MRIAQFVNTLDISDGGPARNAFELNLSLNHTQGTQADLFSIKGSIKSSVLQVYKGELGALPTPGPRWIRYRQSEEARHISLSGLSKNLAKYDVAIIHGYYLPWITPLAFLLKKSGVPFVITPHGSLTSRQQKYSQCRKAIFDASIGHWVRSRSIAFVTGSFVESQELAKKFPSANVKVGGVGTPIPALPHDEWVWNRPIQLLSMSRLAPKKRIDISITATALLKERGIPVTLNIAGDGPIQFLDKLRVLAEELGVSSQVNFVGQLSSELKSATFFSSDVFLLPSEDENFGIGLAEALAHGLPAVTTEAVAAARFMTSFQGEVLARPDATDVADAIETIASGIRENYVLQTRQFARDHYSWPTAAENWIKALASVER